MSKTTLTVDGTAYPLDLDVVTAEQVVGLRSLAVTPDTLAIVIAQYPEGSTALPEIVGLMALSLWQQDKPVDLGWLARHLTAESTIHCETEAPEVAGDSLADHIAAIEAAGLRVDVDPADPPIPD